MITKNYEMVTKIAGDPDQFVNGSFIISTVNYGRICEQNVNKKIGAFAPTIL